MTPDNLKPGDWLGLALCWLQVASTAIEHAERAYERSVDERDDAYWWWRDALEERVRMMTHLIRVEQLTLEKLAREREAA